MPDQALIAFADELEFQEIADVSLRLPFRFARSIGKRRNRLIRAAAVLVGTAGDHEKSSQEARWAWGVVHRPGDANLGHP